MIAEALPNKLFSPDKKAIKMEPILIPMIAPRIPRVNDSKITFSKICRFFHPVDFNIANSFILDITDINCVTIIAIPPARTVINPINAANASKIAKVS